MEVAGFIGWIRLEVAGFIGMVSDLGHGLIEHEGVDTGEGVVVGRGRDREGRVGWVEGYEESHMH